MPKFTTTNKKVMVRDIDGNIVKTSFDLTIKGNKKPDVSFYHEFEIPHETVDETKESMACEFLSDRFNGIENTKETEIWEEA